MLSFSGLFLCSSSKSSSKPFIASRLIELVKETQTSARYAYLPDDDDAPFSEVVQAHAFFKFHGNLNLPKNLFVFPHGEPPNWPKIWSSRTLLLMFVGLSS